ncbi:MAG: general secretion pathway protein GspK [Planctomycetes bacterium]|nr:general secretion pathway protein GspK [Planctomycetota bacterium]
MSQRCRRGGFALILVLFLSLLLTVAVGAFATRTMTARRLARSRAESTQLLFAARAGVEEAKAVLWQRAASAEEDEPGNLAPPASLNLNLSGVAVFVEFEDEAGKLPVNDFASAGPRRRKALALALARAFDILDLGNSTSLATAVRDYIDKDSEGSGESGARNGPVFHTSELIAAKGMTTETLYTARHEGCPAAAVCLSAWHHGKVNVNSASKVVLRSLAPCLTKREVEAIIAARCEQPFSSGEDFGSRTNVSEDARSQLLSEAGFGSDTFTLRVEARRGTFVRRVKAVVWVEQPAAHTLYFGEGWDF